MKKKDDGFLAGFLIGIIIGSIMGVVCGASHVNAAEADSIPYTSASDLMARVDSVTGVVDTVDYERVPVWTFGPAWDDTMGYREYVLHPILRTRKLVSVAVARECDITIIEQIGGGYLGNTEHYRKVARGEAPPMPIDTFTVGQPGTAVVWWEWIEK